MNTPGTTSPLADVDLVELERHFDTAREAAVADYVADGTDVYRRRPSVTGYLALLLAAGTEQRRMVRLILTEVTVLEELGLADADAKLTPAGEKRALEALDLLETEKLIEAGTACAGCGTAFDTTAAARRCCEGL